jgi:hypothetical protein
MVLRLFQWRVCYGLGRSYSSSLGEGKYADLARQTIAAVHDGTPQAPADGLASSADECGFNPVQQGARALFGTGLSIKLPLEFLIGDLFGRWPSQVRRPKTLQHGSDR